MAEGKTLKEQNAWLIRAAMIGHMAAFGLIAGQPLRLMRLDGPSLAGRLEALAAPGTAALGLIVIASLILLGAINPGLEGSFGPLALAQPHFQDVVLLHRLGPKCSHVDMDRLAGEFGPLPTNSEEQNRLFYKIYRTHRDEVGVLDAHGRYLAARDISTITALLMLVLPWLAWWSSGNEGHAIIYGLALLAVYGFCALAAQNYSLRMVQHVLALASASDLSK